MGILVRVRYVDSSVMFPGQHGPGLHVEEQGREGVDGPLRRVDAGEQEQVAPRKGVIGLLEVMQHGIINFDYRGVSRAPGTFPGISQGDVPGSMSRGTVTGISQQGRDVSGVL